MKLNPNTKKRTPKPNPNKAELPAVLTATENDVLPPPEGWLPDDTVEIQPGPATTIEATANENDTPVISYDTTSEDLMAAATGRYDDIPPKTDAEIVAGEIIKQLEQQPVGLTDTEGGDTIEGEILYAVEHPSAPEQKFANASFEAISGGGQRFLDALKASFDDFASNCHRKQLWLVAKGNDGVDWIKKTGNELWIEYDRLSKRFVEDMRKRKAAELQAVAEYLGKQFEDKLTDIAAAFEKNGNYTVEMRRMSNRIEHLEEVLHKDIKKTNNAVTTVGNRIELTQTVSPKLLAQYTKAMLSGRHTKAVDFYRTMTGADLEAATAAIEGMVAA